MADLSSAARDRSIERQGADLFAAARSIIGTAARRGIDAYQAIRQTLRGQSILEPG